MNRKSYISVLFFMLCFLFPVWVHGQISAPSSNASDKISYPVFPETDDIYIFCAADSLSEVGNLQVTTTLTGTKTFLWEKYNSGSASFEFYFSESSDTQTSEISNLADGCYRATITQGANSEVYRAWVFNNWITVEGSVSESNCESFRLNGEYTTARLNYYDLTDNSKLSVFKDIKFQWKEGGELVASVLSPQIFSPPTKDTYYTLHVSDKFGCEVTTGVLYESIVTKAAFTVDFGDQNSYDELEAPLTVTFNNDSENGDPDQFTWSLFRDLDEIKEESGNSGGLVDSIMVFAYDENPVYTYENTGSYMVKLVSKKVSEFHTCVDSVYLDNFIVIKPSFVEAPNVFTPNGDGANDDFVVKFWSMKQVQISIFNRWGKKVHYWKENDVRGFEGTYTRSVWNGKIGNRYATPGVYYYVVEGWGRDNEKRRAHGFFHLFRGKN